MRKLTWLFSSLIAILPAEARAQDATAPKPAEPAATPPAPAATPAAAAPAPAATPAAATGPVDATAAAKTAAPPAAPLAARTSPTHITPPPPATVAGKNVAGSDDSWQMGFHGYIRAPMRVGIGRRAPNYGCTGMPCPAPGESNTTLHAPILPDDQYWNWQYTAHNRRDLAEVYFSLGNSWARGTVGMEGHGFTEANFTDSTLQYGINQGYIDITPDLGYENVRIGLRAGAFWNKYGTAGRYDTGEYDTYLFGRTHTAGEKLRLEYDLDDDNMLWVEHGIGAKNADPSLNNNAQFTMLDHAHVGFVHGDGMEITANYLYSWAQEETREGSTTSLQNIGDGKLWVAGFDGRFELGAAGYLYAGYSHIGAERAAIVGRAIEVLHSAGGGEFQQGVTDNYLGPSCVNDPATNTPKSRTGPMGTPCSVGNGHVDSVLAQYELSIANLTEQMAGRPKFDGDGQDVKLVAYGMYNQVHSTYAANNGMHKLKYGADLQFAALPWLTVALRADHVAPNNRIADQSFSVISPRLVFKSKWVTREAISLQYSRYMYAARTCAGITPSPTTGAGVGDPSNPASLNCAQPPATVTTSDSFGGTAGSFTNSRGAPTSRPDLNVVKLEATMWW
ncbi:MAG TPA: hypothetical protein VGI10_15735 [Polyangiaceae bacterium]